MSEQISIQELYFSHDGKNMFFETVRDNLFEGQELKNYNSLCSILCLDKPYPQGNARIRHIEAWRCFFDFDYVPDTYRIRINKIYPYDEIKEYDPPLSHNGVKKENSRQKFHFIDYIVQLLEDYSARNGYLYTLTFSNIELLELLGFVNENFSDLYTKVKTLCKNHEKQEDNIECFESYNIISRLLTSDIIPAQCKVMLKNNILEQERRDIYFIKKTDTNVLLKATDKQVKVINDIKNQISESKEDRYNGTYFLSVLMSNDILTNEELKNRNFDFQVEAVKKEYVFSKDNFRPHELSDEMVEIYRHKINDYFINERLAKKEIVLPERYNIMNPKYKGRSREELTEMIRQKIIMNCKL